MLVRLTIVVSSVYGQPIDRDWLLAVLFVS